MTARYVFSVFLTTGEAYYGVGKRAASFDRAIYLIQETYGNDLSSVILEKVTFSG